MAETTKTLKNLPTWNGDREGFQLWWTRFKAYASKEGWAKALKPEFEKELPDKEEGAFDSDPDVAKLQKNAVKLNAEAVWAISMALTTNSIMTKYYATISEEYPEGVAWKTVQSILLEYQPKDDLAAVEYRERLAKVSMKDNEDPKVLIEKLDEIRNMYSHANFVVQEVDLVAVAMQKAPDVYKAALAQEQRIRRRVDNKPLVLSDVYQVMSEMYRMNIGNVRSSKGTKPGKDVALAGTEQAGNGAKCYNCGKQGHKAAQCTAKNNQGNEPKTKFTGKCNLCGKVGHKKADCWDLPANADKRPKNYKPKNHQSSGEAGAVGVEALLGAVDVADLMNDGMGEDDVIIHSLPEWFIEGDVDVGASAGEVAGATLDDHATTLPDSFDLLKDPEIWIGDSGASRHSTFSSVGMYDCHGGSADDRITVGNGASIEPDAVGKLKVTVCDKFGVQLNSAVLQDVVCSKNARFNMFSITKCIMNGWQLQGDHENGLILVKDDIEVRFDIKISTNTGVLYCALLKRNIPTEEIGGAAVEERNRHVIKINIKAAHDRLGHCDEERTRAIARLLNWSITRGTLPPCRDCAAGKARQRNVPQISNHVPTTDVNGRVYLDVSTIRGTDEVIVTNPVWLIKVDEATQMKFSSFHSSKNAIVEPSCEQFKLWMQSGKPVKAIRCDNAGENKLLEQRANSATWQLAINFEYTARNTPQQNSLAEVAFATVANRGRAMMHRANLPLVTRYRLCKEAFKTATLLDGLTAITINNVTKTRVEHWSGSLPKFVNHLRTWGEAGTVTIRNSRSPKLADRGVQCMFVGYALNHEGDCYRMWDPLTNRVHITRDVIWLRRMFFARPPELGEEETVQPVVSFIRGVEVGERDDQHHEDNDADTDDDADTTSSSADSEQGESTDDDTSGDSSTASETDDESQKSNPSQPESLDAEQNRANAVTVRTTSGRTVRAPQRLIKEIGALTADRARALVACAEWAFKEEVPEYVEIACVGAGVGGGFTDTKELHVMTYKEALTGPDRPFWLKAIEQEHERMMEHNVWTAIDKMDVPKGAKIIDSTWAMKKKSNGTYRARINARGFRQVAGVHYASDSISAPVTNDATIRICLVIMMMMQGTGKLCDVKGAFLHGTFCNGEEIYLRIPQGFEKYYNARRQLLRLTKTIYGLKQSAMAFWRELLVCMRDMGYERSKADPCLYFKWNQGRLNLWLSWIDDCLNLGTEDGVSRAIAEMKARFDCDEVSDLSEYVGCRLHHDKEAGAIKFTQPVLIQSFVDEFELPERGDFRTPAAAGQILIRGDNEGMLDDKHQHLFRKGVGKLLYLTRWSRPDIRNAVRELTRCCGVAKEAHYKAMLRVMKYCVNTKTRGWCLRPMRKWDGRSPIKLRIYGKSDANMSSDPESRKSISGTTVYLEGTPVMARSGSQEKVSLSICESETHAGVGCVQDMLYVKKVVESIGLEVELPMVLYMDNQAAVDLANGWSIAGRTRHMETPIWFIRELKEQGVLKIEWISGDTNESDMFTKNLPFNLFEKHMKNFCTG